MKTVPEFHASRLGLGKERPKVKTKGARTCWVCGTKMAAKIKDMVVIPTRNPSHTVELNEGDKLFAVRRNHIEFSVKGSGTRRVASIYKLGVEGGEILQIGEDGIVRN